MKNIVIIGGGTGTFTLLSGLRHFPSKNSVIVSTADDGGSTGRLRKDLGVLPPGDIRQCLVGLSYTDEVITNLFAYRFTKGELSGHNVGNIILAALEKITKNSDEAIHAAAKLLNVRGEVVPVTLKPTTLSAVLNTGKKIVGEHNIDSPRSGSFIKKLSLSPAKVNPQALKLIQQAEVIVFGPGDLFTSTLPNVLVKGVKEALKNSKAKKVFITNIMTKNGQSDNFKASDFVKEFENYAGKGIIDVAIVNSQKPDKHSLVSYTKDKAFFVEPDIENFKNISAKVLALDLISNQKAKPIKGDVLKRSTIRHDEKKIAKIIWDLV